MGFRFGDRQLYCAQPFSLFLASPHCPSFCAEKCQILGTFIIAWLLFAMSRFFGVD